MVLAFLQTCAKHRLSGSTVYLILVSVPKTSVPQSVTAKTS